MTDATDEHWLVWSDPDVIEGCHCGFVDDSWYGEKVVKHLLAVGWEEGYEQAHEDEVSSGLYNYSPNPLVIDVIERTENPYA